MHNVVCDVCYVIHAHFEKCILHASDEAKLPAKMPPFQNVQLVRSLHEKKNEN